MSRSYIPKALREQVTARGPAALWVLPDPGNHRGLTHGDRSPDPRGVGGRTEEENLWLACSLCNDSRGCRIAGVDPVTGGSVRLFNPRQQVWAQHFRWAGNGSRIVGLTPIGRATVIALNLNRQVLVQARLAWVAVGWHPPRD